MYASCGTRIFRAGRLDLSSSRRAPRKQGLVNLRAHMQQPLSTRYRTNASAVVSVGAQVSLCRHCCGRSSDERFGRQSPEAALINSVSRLDRGLDAVHLELYALEMFDQPVYDLCVNVSVYVDDDGTKAERRVSCFSELASTAETNHSKHFSTACDLNGRAPPRVPRCLHPASSAC